jgi:hypothetical protein
MVTATSRRTCRCSIKRSPSKLIATVDGQAVIEADSQCLEVIGNHRVLQNIAVLAGARPRPVALDVLRQTQDKQASRFKKITMPEGA